MMRNHRVKMLLDQVTGQVVWLTYFYDSLPVPMWDPTLNIQRFRGDLEIDVWNNYLKFKLFYSNDLGRLTVGEFTEDFRKRFPQVQLQRAKSIGLDYINGGIDFISEKYGVWSKGMHEQARAGRLQDERWLRYFQDEYGCSRESAIKLAEFKTSEWNDIEFFLESTRHTAFNKIRSAKSLVEVNDIYECTCAKLFFSMRPNLLTLPALAPPF